MKTASTTLAALLLTAVSIGLSNPVHAADFQNKLNRCTRDGRATLCYEAYSTAKDMAESCQMFQLRTKLNRLQGGGLLWTSAPGADESKSGVSACNVAVIQTGYVGNVNPCAPGGPVDWKHVSQHIVKWTALGLLTQNDIDTTRTTTYPLRVSTCEGGGVIP